MGGSLLYGGSVSCGCFRKECALEANSPDLTYRPFLFSPLADSLFGWQEIVQNNSWHLCFVYRPHEMRAALLIREALITDNGDVVKRCSAVFA